MKRALCNQIIIKITNRNIVGRPIEWSDTWIAAHRATVTHFIIETEKTTTTKKIIIYNFVLNTNQIQKHSRWMHMATIFTNHFSMDSFWSKWQDENNTKHRKKKKRWNNERTHTCYTTPHSKTKIIQRNTHYACKTCSIFDPFWTKSCWKLIQNYFSVHRPCANRSTTKMTKMEISETKEKIKTIFQQ